MWSRKSVSLPLLLLLTLLSLVVAYFLFRIKQVECHIQTQNCPSQLSEAFQPLIGQAIFFFNDQQLSELLVNQPSYLVTDYQFHLPDTLSVQLAPQTVAYLISSSASPTALAVTTTGEVVMPITTDNLPTVLVNDTEWQMITETQTLSPATHHQISTIVKELSTQNINFQTLYLRDDQTLVVYLPDQPVVILDPLQVAINALRLKMVLAEVKLHPLSLDVQEIDVRYKLPVLRNHTSIPRHTSY